MTTIHSTIQASYDAMFGRDRSWQVDIDADPFKTLLDAEAMRPDEPAGSEPDYDEERDTRDAVDGDERAAAEETSRDVDGASATATAASTQQANLPAQHPLLGLSIVKSKVTKLGALAAPGADRHAAADGRPSAAAHNPFAGLARSATSVVALTRGATGGTGTPVLVKQGGQGSAAPGKATKGDTLVLVKQGGQGSAGSGKATKGDTLVLVKQGGEGMSLDATVTRQRAAVTSRPQSTVAGAMIEGAETILAKRSDAAAAAKDAFAKGQSAIERLAARKADLHAGADASANASGNGKPPTFGERMADLAERLGELHANGNDNARQTRPNPVTLPASANAGLAANPSARAGDLPFTLTAGDGDPLALNAQQGQRAASASASTSQAAARAPQSPAGAPAEQVSVQIRHGLRNDSDRISVRLQPASLGKVEVKLELAPDRTVQAIVTAERPETLDMLARDARILQRALEEAGLQTDSNSLTFRHDGSGGNDAAGFADRDGRNAGAGELASNGDAPASETAGSDEPAARRAVHDGVLDVEI